MKTVGFNLRKALRVIGIDGKEAAEIIDNKGKAHFSTKLLFRAFSSFTAMLLLSNPDKKELSQEEFEEMHNNSMLNFFPGVFYEPTAEEAAASARKWERLKAAEEIMEQQEGE